MRAFITLLAPFLALLLVSPCALAIHFRPSCKVKSSILALKRVVETGVIELMDDDGSRRLTTHEDFDLDVVHHRVSLNLRGGGDWSQEELTIPANTVSSTPTRALQESDEIYFMRLCRCKSYNLPEATEVYCQLNVNYCGYPWHGWQSTAADSSELLCFSNSKSREFASTASLILVVWFGLVFTCIVATSHGRSCLSFIPARILPCWNRFHANRLLRWNPDQARMLILRNLYLRRLMLERQLRHIAPDLGQAASSNEEARQDEATEEEEEKPVPTSLRLRTRAFRVPKKAEKVAMGISQVSASFDDEEDLDTSCIICFQTLVDGDRIGALECNHQFHAECLKSWLKYRNVCPLCQAHDVAELCCDQVQQLPTSEGIRTLEEESSGTRAQLHGPEDENESS